MTIFAQLVAQIERRAEQNRKIEDDEAGHCCDCDCVTENYDTYVDDWICEDCREDSAKEAAEDLRLDYASRVRDCR